MRLMISMLACSLIAAAQTPGRGYGIIKGKAPAPTTAPAAALNNVQVAKGADGKWRCMSAGKACSEAQVQAMGAVIKGRSNIKDNLLVNPDGTVQCTIAGKPCSDTQWQSATAELNQAAQNGPQSK